MSKSYSRLKKFRKLKIHERSEKENEEITDYIEIIDADVDEVESDELEVDEIITDYELEELGQKSLREKLKIWAIENSSEMSDSAVTQLLLILRDEGYTDLPKTAITLKKSSQIINLKEMMDDNDKMGKFLYIGLKKGLESTVIKEHHEDRVIRIFVNLDGMKVYNKARITFWPILARINNILYKGQTVFPVGIFCGSAKPKSVDEYMNDFIEETNPYIMNGVEIDNTTYELEISGFICDTPARAYVKCTKGHAGFCSCERCDVKGTTLERRRVFPELDREHRTHESFVAQADAAHHLPEVTSPLLRLRNFDIVRGFMLDSMHLLFAGIMNNLLHKLYEPKGFCRLNRNRRNDLEGLFNDAAVSVSAEFQRKVYDLTDLANWKSSQFRVCLLYLGPMVLKHVLSPMQYQHFLLLHVACRLLMNANLAVRYCQRAKNLLRKFVALMPSFYGEASQVGNVHNLIHVADDVEYLKTPLSNCDAFPFESYLGRLRRMVHTSKEPLIQVANKLNQLNDIQGNIKVKDKTYSQSKKLKAIELQDFVLKSKAPNNIFKRRNGKYYEIHGFIDIERVNQSEFLVMKVMKLSIIGDLYEYPYSSKDVGFCKVERCEEKIKKIKISKIVCKCLLFEIKNELFLSELLH